MDEKLGAIYPTLKSAGVRTSGRTVEELEDMALRVRKRRRESAKRSRDRRVLQEESLREENESLRGEIDSLRERMESLLAPAGASLVESLREDNEALRARVEDLKRRETTLENTVWTLEAVVACVTPVPLQDAPAGLQQPPGPETPTILRVRPPQPI